MGFVPASPCVARRAVTNCPTSQTTLCSSVLSPKRHQTTLFISIMSQPNDGAAPSSSSPVPSADPSAQEPPATQPTNKGKPKKEYRQMQMPTPEQIVQEDMMNNCGIRTVMSGVMGMGLGLVFGVVMGSMDAGVSVCIAD